MTRFLSRLIFSICGLSLLACAPSTAKTDAVSMESAVIETPAPPLSIDEKAAEFEVILNQYIALNQRLENVAYTVLSSNTLSCPETVKSAGMKVHTVQDYPDALQSYAGVFFGISDHPVIRIIAANSSADQVGLKPGDRVVKLGEFDLVSGPNAKQFFEALRTKEFTSGATTIEVRRGNQNQVRRLSPKPICGYPAQLFYSEAVNAHTNGEEIWVTSELLRQVESDTSLALIIAHELAHATQGHMNLEPTKALELDADRLSLTYLARAGYDPEEAVGLWQENPLNHEKDETGSHPTRAERLAVLKEALAGLQAEP